MRFSIVVTQPPYERQASWSALKFIRAAIEVGHRVDQVFFYQGGVSNASSMIEPPQNEPHLPKLWSELSLEHDIKLIVCVAAAKRRGVSADHILPGFSISGLGQLMDACIESDRTVSFC